MSVFEVFLIVGLVIFLVIFFTVIYVILKIRKNTEYMGLFNALKNYKEISRQELEREKSVVGMTNLVLPQVIEEVPDFNVDMIYNTIESNLNKIFSALENKTYVKDDDLLLLEQKINSTIDDLKERNSSVRYDDIKFHKHALKRFERGNGVLTLTTSSSVEYYYIDGSNSTQNIKRQTRYTCTFVYILDYKKIHNKNREKLFVLHCPNCGAPLDSFSEGNCRYCMAKVGDVLSKTWKMSSYKEDYN